jgi:hypothetical protein
MPYLQLDSPRPIPPDRKRRLARALAERYADLMETAAHIPSVCIRDAENSGPFRLEGGELQDVAVLMCDVRRGREADQRERAARGFIELIAAETDLDPLRIVVEFTQHEATEMFRYGAFAPEWQAGETG